MAGAKGQNAADGGAIAQQIHHPFPIDPRKGAHSAVEAERHNAMD